MVSAAISPDPNGIGTVAGGQAIFQALSDRGYRSDFLWKSAIGNWMRVLSRIVG
jgi:membrane dipeptidase